ncbi:MAG: hypothetical protein COV66_09150 [Nitrospinae bacterium CG11_big_fil_rev_8_21_14_0_20_45_15]|nr:MAG: hypothetical protein COV66_09150 [Nitrospinae bacterium CG11_big_fil_rev_8_21_14_0_20_45_15]
MVSSIFKGVSVGLALLLSASITFADAPPAVSKTVNPLAKVFTVVGGPGIDSNSTFIITDNGVIVVDTRTTPDDAKHILSEIRQRTDSPIVYTINTHYHGDHTFGNQYFLEGKTIIAHKNVHKILAGIRGKEHLELFKTFKLPGLEETKVTPPNLIYDGNLEIFLGGYRLKIAHSRGHTDGDSYIFMPELQTVITGDLVSNKIIPYMNDGYVEDWIKAVDDLELLRAEIYIPGHGEVGGKPIVIAMKHYLINLKTWVVEQIKQGKTLEETQTIVGPKIKEKYADWKKHKWIDMNIERAYTEFSLAGNDLKY